MAKLVHHSKQSKTNKTGLQPVSRPVEQILWVFSKGFKNYPKGIIIRENGAQSVEKMCSKNV